MAAGYHVPMMRLALYCLFAAAPVARPLHVGPPSPLTASGLRMLRSMRVEATLVPRKVPKDVIVPASPDAEPAKAVEAVERMIEKECEAIQCCEDEEECVIEEAESLREQLKTFVDSQGWNKMIQALKWKSMQERMHGVVVRRRGLREKAEKLRSEKASHKQLLEQLEEQAGRLRKKLSSAQQMAMDQAEQGARGWP